MRLEQGFAHAAVAAGHDGLEAAEIRLVIAVVDAFGVQVRLQQVYAPQVFLRRDLRRPLERREGLGDKIGRGQIDGQAALFPVPVFSPDLQDLVDQLGDADDVLVRLGRQAQHEIELHAVPAAGECRGAGFQNLMLGDIFVDRVTQALRASLGRKGQSALAHLLHAQHQLT